jgi:two-component system, LuxR family, sensor kinase FixL
MNWVPLIWSMGASACAAIALINLVIWFNDRRNFTHLLFASAAIAVAAIVINEMRMMTPESTEGFGWWLRWTQVPLFVAIVFIVWFPRFYFQTGRVWLAARGGVTAKFRREPVVMRGVSFEIARRRQAEDRFRAVVEAVPSALIVLNSVGTITFVNAKTESAFGYSRQELIGRPIEVLIPRSFPHERMGDRAIGAGRELFAGRKDGSEIPVEVGLNPFHTSEGEMVLVSVVDITERRNAEREQIRQRNELAHLSRVAMLGELSGSLAHELNQPLTAILSNAQAAQEFLAQNPADLQEVHGILQDIVDEDRRAREVIRRLRLLFRKGEVHYESLDLNELVLEVVKLMTSDLTNHGIAVRTDLARELPSVNGDRVQLQQVLINLIVNATDAMNDNGNAERRLCLRTALGESGEVELSVADAGCGIPDGEIERIFEPFHTTKENGMGLGLAVCRTIISAHAGKLWATNNPDRGACLHVTFAPLPVGAA